MNKTDRDQRIEKILEYDSFHFKHPSFTIKPKNQKVLKFEIKDDIDGSRSSIDGFIKFACNHTILSREDEAKSFIKYNYLKYLISYWQNKPKKLINLPEVENLIELAVKIRNEIIARNIRFMISFSKHVNKSISFNRYHTFDDLISDSYTKLFHIIDRFDYNRGFKFSTYVQTALFREFCRSQKEKRKQATTFNIPDDLEIEDQSSVEEHRMINKFDDLLKVLNDRERFIIENHYLNPEPWKLREFGEEFNLSRERVRQIEMGALEKLREQANRI